MNTLDAVKSACTDLDYEVRSYSGRGMYGKSCLGIDVPRGTSAAKVAFQLAVELARLGDEGEDAISDLSDLEWCQDSMGMDSIVYLPGLAWEESEEEEGEDDEA